MFQRHSICRGVESYQVTQATVRHSIFLRYSFLIIEVVFQRLRMIEYIFNGALFFRSHLLITFIQPIESEYCIKRLWPVAHLAQEDFASIKHFIDSNSFIAVRDSTATECT